MIICARQKQNRKTYYQWGPTSERYVSLEDMARLTGLSEPGVKYRLYRGLWPYEVVALGGKSGAKTYPWQGNEDHPKGNYPAMQLANIKGIAYSAIKYSLDTHGANATMEMLKPLQKNPAKKGVVQVVNTPAERALLAKIPNPTKYEESLYA